MTSRLLALSLLSLLAVAGCAADPEDAPATSDAELVRDAASITRRDDGRFDVVCQPAAGSTRWTEIVTAADLSAQNVCVAPPNACAPLDLATAASLMPAGESRAEVGRFELLVRSRKTNPITGTGAWSDWRTAFSGTVTLGTTWDTKYKNILALTMQGPYDDQSGYEQATWDVTNAGIVAHGAVGGREQSVGWLTKGDSTYYRWSPAKLGATTCGIDAESDVARVQGAERSARLVVTFGK